MFQVLYDYQKSWPESGPLRLEGQFTHEINISPTIAWRRANGFLAGYVTMMVMAGQPMLALGKRPIWRVPACLYLPGLGEVSTLGAVDVDAQTGEVIMPSANKITQMQELAHAIAAHFALPTAPTS